MAAITVNQAWDFPLLDKVSKFAGSLTDRFLGSTSLVGMFSTQKKADPFGSYGVTAVADVRKRSNVDVREPTASTFSVEEAKKRLQDFVGSKFKPDTFNDLVGYLGDRFMKLETWVMKAGPLNMLVDTNSQKAVPAAAVSPKLSYANALKFNLLSDLKAHIGNVPTPAKAFGSWDSMMYELGTSLGNIGYTMSKGQAYLGKVYADEHDVRSLKEIAMEAKARNVSLILPTQDGTLNTPRILGLPVLKKLESLKAEKVHPGLSHESLSTHFGTTLLAEIDRKAKAKASRMAMSATNAPKFDLSTFLKPKAEREAERLAASKVDDTPAFFVENMDVKTPTNDEWSDLPTAVEMAETEERTRNLSVRQAADGSGRLVVYCNDLNEELDAPVSDLPAQHYVLEDENGHTIGHVEVSSTGNVKHYGRDGREIEMSKDENLENYKTASMSR